MKNIVESVIAMTGVMLIVFVGSAIAVLAYNGWVGSLTDFMNASLAFILINTAKSLFIEHFTERSDTP